MAIDYTGHCALTAADCQRRIAYARRTRPDLFGVVVRLTDAHGLGAFGLEIGREFGIEAQCRFSVFVADKERLGAVDEAIEHLYRVFGTAALVITWGNDSIRRPLQDYAPHALD